MRRGQPCPPIRVCTTFARRTRLSSSVARGARRPAKDRLSLNELLRRARIEVHGIRLNEPDPSPEPHSLAVTVRDIERADLLYVLFSAYWEPLVFELPPLDPRRPWQRWIDTDRDAPDDVHDCTLAPFVEGPTYAVQPRSLVTLVAESPGRPMGRGGDD